MFPKKQGQAGGLARKRELITAIERLWLVLKNRFFTNYYTRDPDELLERVTFAFASFIENPTEVASICRA